MRLFVMDHGVQLTATTICTSSDLSRVEKKISSAHKILLLATLPLYASHRVEQSELHNVVKYLLKEWISP